MIFLPDAENARSYLHSSGQNTGMWRTNRQTTCGYYIRNVLRTRYHIIFWNNVPRTCSSLWVPHYAYFSSENCNKNNDERLQAENNRVNSQIWPTCDPLGAILPLLWDIPPTILCCHQMYRMLWTYPAVHHKKQIRPTLQSYTSAAVDALFYYHCLSIFFPQISAWH